MLSDLFEIGKWVFLAFHNRCHPSIESTLFFYEYRRRLSDLPTKSSLFQLLTTVETITKLEQTDVVLGDLVYEMPSSP